jgi:hypothetical protein
MEVGHSPYGHQPMESHNESGGEVHAISHKWDDLSIGFLKYFMTINYISTITRGEHFFC